MNIVAAVFVPAVLAGVCWLVSWRLWRRDGNSTNGYWGGALAFALGYVSGHVVLSDWPPFPPNTAAQWLVYLAALAGVVALFEGKWGRSAPWSWRIRAGMSGLFAFLLLRSMIRYTWAAWEAAVWILSITVLTTITWSALEALARRRPGAQLPLTLWFVCAVASAAQVMSGSALLGQLTGALAAILGAAVVLGLWAGRLSLSRGAISVFVLLYASLLWQGCFYSELPIVSGALFLIAPVAAWVPESTRFRELRPVRAAVLRFAATAVPLAIALGIVVVIWMNAPAELDY